jgi:hypothetical protein
MNPLDTIPVTRFDGDAFGRPRRVSRPRMARLPRDARAVATETPADRERAVERKTPAGSERAVEDETPRSNERVDDAEAPVNLERAALEEMPTDAERAVYGETPGKDERAASGKTPVEAQRRLALRFIPRAEFFAQHFPQSACAAPCRYRALCGEFQANAENHADNVWLVRGDGECARHFKEVTPADVMTLRAREHRRWVELTDALREEREGRER